MLYLEIKVMFCAHKVLFIYPLGYIKSNLNDLLKVHS